MTMQSKFTAVALALACMAAPAMAAEYDFDGALHSLRAGRMSEAYGRFLTLGLQGDPDAASLRVVAGRPSLRPQPQPESAGYDATGISQRPIPADTIAGR